MHTYYLPYSRKFSLGVNFAKLRCVVLRENFTRLIFAHMRFGKIKFHDFINGSLAVSSSLEKCLAAAESPFSLAIWTSVHYQASYKALYVASSWCRALVTASAIAGANDGNEDDSAPIGSGSCAGGRACK